MTPVPQPAADSSALASMHCEAGAQRLTPTEFAKHMQALSGWSQTGDAIEKTYSFADFHATIGFVNALAWIANREDHHPDLRVSYNRCVVAWSTHDAGGVTRNDIVCAAKTDRLFAA
jgi:4a-hydroxytetrahydrobiopterin dehydratase